jgi:hypothetical protein
MRRKGFGVGLVVAFAALLGSAAHSILILLHLRNMGGPDLLTRVPPEMVLVRLAVTVPLPLVAAVFISKLPGSRRALTIWMCATAVALAVQLPFLFLRHTGGALFISIALAANVVGLVLARGRGFRNLCQRFEDKV